MDCHRAPRRAILLLVMSILGKKIGILSGIYCLALVCACGELSLQVVFEIPEKYHSNPDCGPNCHDQWEACENPDPDWEQCNAKYEDCLTHCNGNGGQQDPECRQRCEEMFQECVDPGEENQCKLLWEWCLQICEEKDGIVASSSLQVFQPAAVDLFDCEDLAFSEVNAGVLQASLVMEVTSCVEGSEELLRDIDRLAPKVLLAQAFDRSGNLVVVACAELVEISGKRLVVLAGEPATDVKFQRDEFQDWTLGGMGLPKDIGLDVTDAQSRPVADVAMRWRTVGPAGRGFDGSLTTGSDGMAHFSPRAPDAPGPATLEILARWQRTPLPLIKGFKKPQVISVSLPEAQIRDIQAGRIGPDGQWGFAALSACDQQPTTQCLSYAYYTDPQALHQVFQVAIDQQGGDRGILLAVVPGVTRDRVIVVSKELWLELDPSGQHMISHDYEPVGFEPVAVYPGGFCPPVERQEYVLVGFGDGSLWVYSPDGHVLNDENNPFSELDSPGPGFRSGCVADQTDQAHRLLIGPDNDQTRWKIHMEFNLQALSFTWQATWSGVDFCPAVGSEPAMLLVSRLGANSPEISRLRIRNLPGTVGINLEEVSSVSILAVPEAIAAGDMDGDGKADVVGLFPLRNTGGYEGYFAQTVLGFEYRNKPISGMLPIGPAQEPPKLWLADIDNNGLDDLAVLRVTSCEQGNDECQVNCEREYEECLQGQEPDRCMQIYEECLGQCQEFGRCIQFLDIYPMGG